MSWNISRMAAAVGPRVSTAVSFMRPELDAEYRAELDTQVGAGRPFVVGSRVMYQSTPQTCGAMALLVALLLTYPGLHEDLEAHPARIEELERDLYADLRSRTGGFFQWPKGLGTPPWNLARELSDDVVEYRSVAIDDRRENAWQALQWAYHATTQGHPVPLYTGGGMSDAGTFQTRLAHSVPRHVVLAIPGPGVDAAGQPILAIYDPASGHVFDVPLLALMERTSPLKALGGWSHVVWAVLPHPHVD